jgi:ribosomal protein S18 acetylase RimI-like enzyme
VIEVRELSAEDLDWKRHELVKAWGSTLVARQGTVIDAMALDGYVAIDGGTKVGLLTYDLADDAVEVVTINVDPEGRGIGRALMGAVKARAQELGAHRLWLSTTNDNVRAFRFYQQWGMDLAAVVHGGVDGSRAVKPSIPHEGQYGIPVRHELIFELQLRA